MLVILHTITDLQICSLEAIAARFISVLTAKSILKNELVEWIKIW